MFSCKVVVMLLYLIFLLLQSGDVETNPGPAITCGKRSCPGNGSLGTAKFDLVNKDDPLTRALNGATYAMGGNIKWVNSVEDAIKEFVAREYPENELVKDGLTTIPDILDSRQMFSTQAKMFGLMDDNAQKVISCPGSNDKKSILSKMSDKYRGEKAEAEVFTALKTALRQEIGAIISSHKTGVTLLEKSLAKEVGTSFHPETDDFKIALTEKLCQAIGVQLNMTEIERDVSHYFRKGKYSVKDIKQVIQKEERRSVVGKHAIMRRDADIKHLKEVLEENKILPNPTLKLNPFKILKHYRMTLELNKQRKEHDIMAILPKYKTVMQVEVKSVKQGADLNAPVTSAIKQLKGGIEELNRMHGHLLDTDWTFKGVIALPDLTLAEKNRICERQKICDICKQQILVGNMETEIPTFVQTQFTASREFQCFKNKDKWEMYKDLLERMAALTYLAPALPAVDTMRKITGEYKEVLGGYADSDFLPDLLNCPVSHLLKWKGSTGSGSTPCIMFLNRQQLSLWNEKRVLFLADYSVGKTTMLKSKAMSLATSGESVLLIFLGTVDDWGQPAPIEAVMDIQNRQHLAGMRSTWQLRNAKKHLTTVTAHELQNFYYENAWNGKFWNPHMMTILEFYLKYHPSANSQHIFIDEAPVIQNHLLLFIHMVSSYPFKAKNLWKTISFGLICILMWFITDIHWSFLLPPAMLLVVIICALLGFFPSSFSPSRTAKHLNAYSNLVHESSTLWIALHTRFFKDRTVGVSNIVQKSDVEKLKAGLRFTLPKLSHNMRNSGEILGKCREFQWTNLGNSSSHFNDAIETADSPPSTKNLSSNPTCKLELASYNEQLEEAVKYAYRTLLKVKPGQEEKCVVILLEDDNDTSRVKNGLTMAGVAPDHLTVYMGGKDAKNLKIFLKKPKGVLLTTDVAFSGMEASSVLYLSKTGLSINHRGSMMRAVSHMVQIAGAFYDSGYNILDLTFMRCSNQKWPAVYYKCHLCNLFICGDCSQTCHDWGEKQDREKEINVIIPDFRHPSKKWEMESHKCWFSLKGTIRGILMAGFRCCDCNANGKCLLKNHI